MLSNACSLIGCISLISPTGISPAGHQCRVIQRHPLGDCQKTRAPDECTSSSLGGTGAREGSRGRGSTCCNLQRGLQSALRCVLNQKPASQAVALIGLCHRKTELLGLQLLAGPMGGSCLRTFSPLYIILQDLQVCPTGNIARRCIGIPWQQQKLGHQI